jgi:hypothetical protein
LSKCQLPGKTVLSGAQADGMRLTAATAGVNKKYQKIYFWTTFSAVPI